MGTNCAPLVADFVLFCYKRDIMMSLADDKQADIIDIHTRGVQYVMKTAQYIQKFYIYTLHNYFH